jgi:hypothetical protein
MVGGNSFPGDDIGMSDLLDNGTAENGATAAVSNQLQQLRQEAVEKLSPELLLMSDFLLASMDLKFQARLADTDATAVKALNIAEKAEKMAEDNQEEVGKLRLEVNDLRTELVSQGKKIAELAKQSPSKVDKLQNVGLAELLGKPGEDQSPSERVGKLHSQFLALVQKKETTNTFILGRKSGYASVTRCTAKGVMNVFFPGIKCIVSKPDNAEFARVLVPDATDAKKVTEGASSLWQELATQGWWMSVDAPEQLRKMEARARSFVAAAKKVSTANKKRIGYVEIEHGFVLKNGVNIIPLFLIPNQVGKNWEKLFDLFVEKIQSVETGDLLGNYGEGATGAGDFLLQWVEQAGMNLLAADVRAIREAQTEE